MNERDKLIQAIQAKNKEIEAAESSLSDVSPVASTKTRGVEATLDPHDSQQLAKREAARRKRDALVAERTALATRLQSLDGGD
jgi:hypothetical protein